MVLRASVVGAQDSTPSQTSAILGTGFTYQGELQDGNGPVTASCDFRFKLMDAATGGGQVGDTQSANNVAVSAGQFSVLLNDAAQFGSDAFAGDARWLDLEVRCPTGVGSFTTLTPRQAVAAAPYALYSISASWDGLTNVPAGFADGVDNGSSYAAGTGLALNGNTFSVTAVPWASLNDVPAGFADNADNDTTYAAGTGLALSNGTFSVQSVPWTALSSVPAGFADNTDNDTTYTAGSGLALSSGAFSLQFAGTGSAATASRSDHNHGGQSWIGVGDYGLRIQNDTASTFATGIIGVVTQANNSAGIHGRHESATGSGRGVFGISESISGIGTSGYASSLTGNTTGVFGSVESPNGVGISGFTAAITGPTVGVFGSAGSSSGTGVSGYAAAATGFTTGVIGGSESVSGTGVMGIAYAVSGPNAGVYGKTNSPQGWAGYFDGDVNINGTLVKSAGSFRIDHPLDPENKYLSHSFVESPDMMNVYNGNITLDANGEGWVDLPAYFEALNRDFRYQLTAIGAPGPNLYIAEAVSNNRFKIAGGTANLVVSWQVTGIRHDSYALANPIIVEEDKSDTQSAIFSEPEISLQSMEQEVHNIQQLQNEVSLMYAGEQSATSITTSEVISSTWENR